MIGQTISHYRVLEKIGGGGMATSDRGVTFVLRGQCGLAVKPNRL